MKFLDKHTNSTQIAIYTYLASIVCFVFVTPFFFFNRMDLPLGILYGGAIIGTANLVAGLMEKKDSEKGTATLSIITIGLRFTLIAFALVLICLMYFRWNYQIFNPIAFVGVYTASLLINVFIHTRKENSK